MYLEKEISAACRAVKAMRFPKGRHAIFPLRCLREFNSRRQNSYKDKKMGRLQPIFLSKLFLLITLGIIIAMTTLDATAQPADGNRTTQQYFQQHIKKLADDIGERNIW